MPKPARITVELRQWCPLCEAATRNVPCLTCPLGTQACAVCGYHPGHVDDDDDDYEWPEVEDEDA